MRPTNLSIDCICSLKVPLETSRVPGMLLWQDPVTRYKQVGVPQVYVLSRLGTLVEHSQSQGLSIRHKHSA